MEEPLFNSRDSSHKRPFGAVRSGETVYFALKWKTEESVFLRIRRDETGGETRLSLLPGKREGTAEVSHRFEEPGLYFYRFESESGLIGRVSPGALGYLQEEAGGDWFIQMVYGADYTAPERFRGRTAYQIFPDRFYRDTLIYTGFKDRFIHTDLGDIPHFRPENGVVKNNDYFGGNLAGIAEKIPYLKELGVGAIYLNPIFEGHSNHRYDTADYRKVDPLLGTHEDFRLLCAAAHRADILVILDGVFSHTGADSIYFNKTGRYGEGGAYRDENSPYRSWYKWDGSAAGYHSWWGFDTLPEVNEEDPGFRNFICGQDGVIDYWMSLGADGLRLDVADELPDSFIAEIRDAVKRCGADKILIGEVWEDASTKEAYGVRRRYFWGEELDSVMNYPFRAAVIDFIRDPDAALFINRVMEIVENYPKPMMDVTMNLLSTHDTDRLITALSKQREEIDREWQAKQKLTRDGYLRGVEMAKLAFALLMTLPGMATVYYGDEIGMQGYRDPFNRGYFSWDQIDRNLWTVVKKLSSVRKKNSAFADGEMIPLKASGGCVAYLRRSPENTVLVAVNRGEEEEKLDYAGRTFRLRPWSWMAEPVEGNAEPLAAAPGI